jgi:hypothetical protein
LQEDCQSSNNLGAQRPEINPSNRSLSAPIPPLFAQNAQNRKQILSERESRVHELQSIAAEKPAAPNSSRVPLLEPSRGIRRDVEGVSGGVGAFGGGTVIGGTSNFHDPPSRYTQINPRSVNEPLHYPQTTGTNYPSHSMRSLNHRVEYIPQGVNHRNVESHQIQQPIKQITIPPTPVKPDSHPVPPDRNVLDKFSRPPPSKPKGTINFEVNQIHVLGAIFVFLLLYFIFSKL